MWDKLANKSAEGPCAYLVAKIGVEALGLPWGSFVQSCRGEGRGGVAFDDRLELEGLTRSYELHLARLLLPPSPARGLGQHVRKSPPVQHVLLRNIHRPKRSNVANSMVPTAN